MPFIASFASFLDESSVMADLILPSHTTLERWVDDVPEPGVGFTIRTVGQPVVEPRWDTRDPGDVLIETAKALGGNAAAALPFENMAAAVKESFRSVHAQIGAGADADFEAFFKKVTAAGGWWSAPQPSPASGQRAESKGQTTRVNFVMPPQPVAARVFAGDAGQMPFMLHLYPSAAFADGRTAHLPWLQEMPDPMTTVMWGSWVEINPETAHKLEIHEGDVLTITSPQGTHRAAGVPVSGPAPRRDCDSRWAGAHAVRALRAERRSEPAPDQRICARSGLRRRRTDRRPSKRDKDRAK